MNSQLVIMGEINFLKKSEFEGQVIYKVQFLKEDETKGLSIIDVKLEPNEDVSVLKKGAKVQIPVTISAMNMNIYYKQRGKIAVK